MERIVLKHISGSKANQVEEFSLRHHNELLLGRDPLSTVHFDPDRDDLVGRQHAKISRDPNNPEQFSITDLGSRNGTFVNKRRISGTVPLEFGDLIQLGANGPEFQFDVEPRPAGAVKATRIAESIAGVSTAAPPTRIPVAENIRSDSPPLNGASPGATKTGGAVGKATVERMIFQSVNETKKREGRKFAIVGGAALVGVLMLFGIALGGMYLYNRNLAGQITDFTSRPPAALPAQPVSAQLTPADIVEKYGKAVVRFEVAWRLIDPARNQAYHLYLPANNQAVPAYIQTGTQDDGSPRYEPIIVPEETTFPGVKNKRIGSQHTGSGFIITDDGFVLTNKHVAATWMSRYVFPPDTPRGILFLPNGSAMENVPPPPDWVPAKTKRQGTQQIKGKRVNSLGDLTGTHDRLVVKLPGRTNATHASLKEASDEHDLALVKIDFPGNLPKTEMNYEYEMLKPGHQVIVLGYPGGAVDIYKSIDSKDVFSPESGYVDVPNPTATVTNIGRILRSDEKKKIINEMGDAIQLNTSSTGAGNSGGPVFDAQGRVIGIFYASSRAGGITLTYAVPIEYAKEFFPTL